MKKKYLQRKKRYPEVRYYRWTYHYVVPATSNYDAYCTLLAKLTDPNANDMFDSDNWSMKELSKAEARAYGFVVDGEDW